MNRQEASIQFVKADKLVQRHIYRTLFRLTGNSEQYTHHLISLINQIAQEKPTDVIFTTEQQALFNRTQPISFPDEEQITLAAQSVRPFQMPQAINVNQLPTDNPIRQKAIQLRNRFRQVPFINHYCTKWGKSFNLYVTPKDTVNGFPNYPDPANPTETNINLGLDSGCFNQDKSIAAITIAHEFGHVILNNEVFVPTEMLQSIKSYRKSFLQPDDKQPTTTETDEKQIKNPVLINARREDTFCHCIGLILAKQAGYDISFDKTKALIEILENHPKRSQISFNHRSPAQWNRIIQDILQMPFLNQKQQQNTSPTAVNQLLFHTERG